MVLGSGFRDVISSWTIVTETNMGDVPGYPAPKVQGHGNKLIGARVRLNDMNHDVLIATGRVHLYEGFTAHTVAFPIFMAKHLGIPSIILTNAAGGLGDRAQPGSLMAISDHINLTGQNLAVAVNPELKSTFIEMVNAYDAAWRDQVVREAGISSGVYAGMLGPTFETPAEARMLKTIGADLAGMSTVQEVIAARICEQRVFACSFVTNEAGAKGVEHSDVLNAVALQRETIKRTLEAAIKYG